jgi:hypothetical protein
MQGGDAFSEKMAWGSGLQELDSDPGKTPFQPYGLNFR